MEQSQEIVFQEVVSNSATEDEPLGTLAGRGVNAGKQKGGKIFNERGNNKKLKTTRPQYGLLLKTYNSDLYQNWINTEWIDGTTGGINAITAVDVTDGKLTMDALILQKKIFNMLNRVAITDGTYQAWREATYGIRSETLPESPIFSGGMQSEIAFDEIVSNAATDEEPLGTLAGRGIATMY